MATDVQISGETLISRIVASLKHGDIALAFGVIGILVVLILPMPKLMLDLLLAVSITFSVMVLLTSLFIEKPLHFSSFPTVLLIATNHSRFFLRGRRALRLPREQVLAESQ